MRILRIKARDRGCKKMNGHPSLLTEGCVVKHHKSPKEVLEKARSVDAEGEGSRWTMSVIKVLPTRFAIIGRRWGRKGMDFKTKVGVVVAGLIAKSLGLA
jgi:hypothetical protein